MTIDNKLQFDKHVSSICKKVNNQLNVMIRFRKLISKATLLSCIKPFSCRNFVKIMYVCMLRDGLGCFIFS